MRAMVRGFAVGTLGLAVLLGSPAVSSAGPPPAARVTFCGCTCWYSGAGGKTQSKGVTFTTDQSCSIYNHQTCYCDDQTCYLEAKTGVRYKGALYECKRTLPLKESEPPAPVPPGGMKPPVAPVKPPAAR
jgi:hypothetical protein